MGGSSTDFSSSGDYNFTSTPDVTRKTAADYAKADNRTYTAPKKGLPAPVGKDVTASSRYNLAVILDQTGSMGEIPRVFIDKMSTMYAETNAAIQGIDLKKLEKGKKLEDKLEVAVVAIGDRRNPTIREQYPLQVLDYCKGTDLVKGVLEINPEKLGGGNVKESYDLGAYYLLNHATTPKAQRGIKPLLVILGDEGFYENTSASEVKDLIGDDLPNDLNTVDVLKKLRDKFDTYVLRPEISNYEPEQYANVHRSWEEIFGSERVLKMDSYERVVDVMIGICGYASNNFKVSEDLLRRRQTPAQVDQVLEMLHPLLSSGKKKQKR